MSIITPVKVVGRIVTKISIFIIMRAYSLDTMLLSRDDSNYSNDIGGY